MLAAGGLLRSPEISRLVVCTWIAHNGSVKKFIKWLWWASLAGLLLLASVAYALHRWVGTEDFRQRLQQQASGALGLPVRMGAVTVTFWPLPAVALQDVTVDAETPVTLERIEIRPEWRPLLQGQLEVATLVVRKAVLPQRGIDGILLALQKKQALAGPAQTVAKSDGVHLAGSGNPPRSGTGASGASELTWLPRRTLLQDVTWISTMRAETAFDGEVRLGADALPDSASLKLIRGHHAGLQATLEREVRDASGQTAAPSVAGDQWSLRVEVGGGEIAGKLGMQRVPALKGHELVLQGSLQTRGVELTALTAPERPLSGKLEADTTLSGKAATTAGLVEALQTGTSFTVRDATIHGLDLVKAVSTVGLSRGGETRLETLAGQVATQGRAINLNNLAATSGVLSASGNVTVSASKALGGRLSVQLATGGKLGSAIGSAVAVPLELGGTVDAPQVTLSRSAMVGAALGTLIMPGPGTGAGANLGERIGDKLKGLFGR